MIERAAPGRRTPSDWILVGEAMAYLALTGIAVRGLPFKTIAGLASRGGGKRCIGREIDSVAWAIDAATVRAPWRPRCFERGLAAYCMLRRRGGRPILYYGARSDDSLGLNAHVWVRAAGRDVVGGEEAARFAVLAVFPPALGRHRHIGDTTL